MEIQGFSTRLKFFNFFLGGGGGKEMKREMEWRGEEWREEERRGEERRGEHRML